MPLTNEIVTNLIKVGNINIGGNNPFVLIAGPCVIEGESKTMAIAEDLIKISEKAGVPFIFKSSYDKANRTSISSYRGPGVKEGLKILKKVKREFSVPLISDVHNESEVDKAGEVLDIIQIPAFLCRQTDLLTKAAATKKVVNIKKGQFLAPNDMGQVIKKIESEANYNILLTERGTFFGYNNLVSDFRSLPIMRKMSYPVVYDATHSVQQPGGLGNKSGGQGEFVPYLSKAAIAVGCDALFLEVHHDPVNAPSDGSNMIKVDFLYDLIKELKKIDDLKFTH